MPDLLPIEVQEIGGPNGARAFLIYPAEAFERNVIAQEAYIEQLEAAPFWVAPESASGTAREQAQAVRLGEAFARLLEAKRAAGVDSCLHTSWCSDQPVYIALTRRRGARLGQPIAGMDAIDVLERAASAAQGGTA